MSGCLLWALINSFLLYEQEPFVRAQPLRPHLCPVLTALRVVSVDGEHPCARILPRNFAELFKVDRRCDARYF